MSRRAIKPPYQMGKSWPPKSALMLTLSVRAARRGSVLKNGRAFATEVNRFCRKKTRFSKKGTHRIHGYYDPLFTDHFLGHPPALWFTDGWQLRIRSFLSSLVLTLSFYRYGGHCSPVDCFTDNKSSAQHRHPLTVLPLPTIINLLSLFLPASPVCPLAHPPAQVFFVPLRDGYFSFSYPDRLFAPVGQNGFSPNVPFRAPSLHPISGCRWPLNGLRQAHGAGLRNGLQSCALCHPTSSAFKVGKCSYWLWGKRGR